MIKSGAVKISLCLAAGIVAVLLVIALLPTAWDFSNQREPPNSPSIRKVNADQFLSKRGKLRRLEAQLKPRREKRVEISGTVMERTSHTPIPDATVYLASPDGSYRSTTDQSGRYVISVAPDDYRIWATASHHTQYGNSPVQFAGRNLFNEVPSKVRLELIPRIAVRSDRDRVDLRLSASATIKGTVRDVDHQPVSGAVIAIKTGGDKLLRALDGRDIARTDRRGRFAVTVPAERNLHLLVEHPEFARASYGPSRYRHLVKGELHTVELTLVDGCIITGKAIDHLGRPIERGVLQEVVQVGSSHGQIAVGAIEGGRFRYTKAHKGVVRLRALPQYAPPTEVLEFTCQDGDRYDNVVLSVATANSADVEGRLFSVDGRLVPEATVVGVSKQETGSVQQITTDAEGRWLFWDVPEGQFIVVAQDDLLGIAVEELRAPAWGVDLVLSGTGTVSGTTEHLDSDVFFFAPLNCRVTIDNKIVPLGLDALFPRQGRYIEIDSGRFRIDHVPACELTAGVSHQGRLQQIEIDVRPGQSTAVSLSLEGGDGR